MRILIVSDAWTPQVNGVTRTLERTATELGRLGHEVSVLGPDAFRTVRCPGEPSIRLALATPRALRQRVEAWLPDAIHVVTEGPLGFAARAACRALRVPFTTSLCTRWPQYLRARCRIPARLTAAALRRFHSAATRTTVATPGLLAELRAAGHRNLVIWSRGVDTAQFRPRPKTTRFARPMHLAVGRVAPEKNLDAFLSLRLPGSRVVVGDGPTLPALRARHPDAVFLGNLEGDDLARVYADADVFVFPSRTDTFGLVMLEALASGVPVAAYPVRGPLDLLSDSPAAGALDTDLARAIERARTRSPAACRALAARWSWTTSARQLTRCLAPIDAPLAHADLRRTRLPALSGSSCPARPARAPGSP